MTRRDSIATYIAERIALPVVLAFAAGVLAANAMHERRDTAAQVASAPTCETQAEDCRP